MIFADPFGRRWGSEILQPVLVEGDVKFLTVRSLVLGVLWARQNDSERQELWPDVWRRIKHGIWDGP